MEEKKRIDIDWSFSLFVCFFIIVLFAMVIAVVHGLVCSFTADSYFCIENGFCVQYTVHDECWFHDGVRREGEYTYVLEDGNYYYFNDYGWKVQFEPYQEIYALERENKNNF